MYFSKINVRDIENNKSQDQEKPPEEIELSNCATYCLVSSTFLALEFTWTGNVIWLKMYILCVYTGGLNEIFHISHVNLTPLYLSFFFVVKSSYWSGSIADNNSNIFQKRTFVRFAFLLYLLGAIHFRAGVLKHVTTPCSFRCLPSIVTLCCSWRVFIFIASFLEFALLACFTYIYIHIILWQGNLTHKSETPFSRLLSTLELMAIKEEWKSH